ncbi:MAG: DUF4249 domain-containing protein [Deferribacteres bacterium]|nr:DUF4249 domain-containing protein [Deferribacteres bacterium]
MSTKIKMSIRFILYSILISGCETIVDVDLPEYNPMLVVNCAFSPDYEWSVRVNHSIGVLDTSAIEPIKNATVEIASDDGQRLLLSRNDNGYYYNPALPYPEANKTYTVHVSAPGYTDVSASSAIPIATQIDSIRTRWLNYAGSKELELTIYLTDPIDIDNYYQLSILEVYIYEGYGIYMDYDSDDLIFGNSGGTTFTDDLISGKSYGIKVGLEAWQVDSGVLQINLLSASEDFYKYYTSYRQYEDTDENPFAEPVFVHSNIENGLGIFAGFNTTSRRFYVPGYATMSESFKSVPVKTSPQPSPTSILFPD